MYSRMITGRSRFTSTILKLDTAYVESICANYFGDNIVTKADKVLQSYYPKPEFTCPLCNAGDKKRGHRPACLIPTEVGYLFKCLKCMENSGAISLYNLLLKINPDVAKNYQWDRWVKKVAGFEADWQRAFFAPDLNVGLVWSSFHSRGQMARLIDSAQQRIWVQQQKQPCWPGMKRSCAKN